PSLDRDLERIARKGSARRTGFRYSGRCTIDRPACVASPHPTHARARNGRPFARSSDRDPCPAAGSSAVMSFRSLFLTERTFLIGWAIVLLMITGWVWAPLFTIGKLALLFFAIALLAEFFMLYGRRSGMSGKRHTLERWSNGDQNPVSLILKSGYGMDMQLRVIDELPVQFQERGLVLRSPIKAWGSIEL